MPEFIINKDTVLFYSAGICTLDNIASLLSVTKKHAKLTSMKITGKNIILKLCDKNAKFYRYYSNEYFVLSPQNNLH